MFRALRVHREHAVRKPAPKLSSRLIKIEQGRLMRVPVVTVQEGPRIPDARQPLLSISSLEDCCHQRQQVAWLEEEQHVRIKVILDGLELRRDDRDAYRET